MKKSQRISTSFIGALALTALSGAAVLSASDGSGAEKLKAMDSNSDGKLSAAEHAAGAKLNFEGMDVNKDGFVTASEMDTHMKALGKDDKMGTKMSSAEKIAVVDTDKDGKLSAAESAAGAQSMFSKMDTNGDGFLTAEEIQAGHDSMMKKPGA
ncbi:MAG: hypothetical protein ABI639_04170 [Thermoanaerobaculia bacterium]